MHKNKAIIVFLAKFFTTYFVLFGAYSLYLNKTQQKGDVFVCSPITSKVAQDVNMVSKMLGYETRIEQNPDELSINYFINDAYGAIIIEGCNSISVIILFLAFIIAFSGSLKATILYGIFGVALIYLVNILRLMALGLLYYKFPEYETVMHDIFFPLVIYGLVFMLWVTWIKYFSNLEKNGTK